MGRKFYFRFQRSFVCQLIEDCLLLISDINLFHFMRIFSTNLIYYDIFNICLFNVAVLPIKFKYLENVTILFRAVSVEMHQTVLPTKRISKSSQTNNYYILTSLRFDCRLCWIADFILLFFVQKRFVQTKIQKPMFWKLVVIAQG